MLLAIEIKFVRSSVTDVASADGQLLGAAQEVQTGLQTAAAATSVPGRHDGILADSGFLQPLIV